MKKTTLILLSLLFVSTIFGQTYSTGTLTLNSTNGVNLNYSAKIDVTSSLVTLTLIGPATGWLGIGFNNTTMANSGDVVIFDGTSISDRSFNGFAATPTIDALQNWTLSSNTTSAGVRTVVGTRPRVSPDTNDYTFSASANALNLVYARKVADFSVNYHGGDSCGSIVSNFTLANESFNINDFQIYPNPANGFTNIKMPTNVESGTIKIYDALGRVVKKQEVSIADNQINTSELTSGSYMVILRTDYGNATKTLIVQ